MYIPIRTVIALRLPNISLLNASDTHTSFHIPRHESGGMTSPVHLCRRISVSRTTTAKVCEVEPFFNAKMLKRLTISDCGGFGSFTKLCARSKPCQSLAHQAGRWLKFPKHLVRCHTSVGTKVAVNGMSRSCDWVFNTMDTWRDLTWPTSKDYIVSLWCLLARKGQVLLSARNIGWQSLAVKPENYKSLCTCMTIVRSNVKVSNIITTILSASAQQ